MVLIQLEILVSIPSRNLASDRKDLKKQHIFSYKPIPRSQRFGNSRLVTLKMESTVLPGIPRPNEPFFNEQWKKEVSLLNSCFWYSFHNRNFLCNDYVSPRTSQ